MRQATGPLPPLVTITLPADITSLAALRTSPRVAAGLADGRVASTSGGASTNRRLPSSNDVAVCTL